MSRKPHSSPQLKIEGSTEALLLQLRKERKLGARRMQHELKRLHGISLSLATIHKTLCRNNAKPLVRMRRKSDFIRYHRPIPGDRVQIYTCKIANGLFQYTAIDDCTRYRVLRLYSRRTAANTLDFIEWVIEEMPFPIQRIQSDRGREFFAIEVQKRLQEYCIKFRPNKPASPHLNGKVERSQKTDKVELYSTMDLRSNNLHLQLAEWQHYYNWDRPHSSLKGKTPMEQCFQLSQATPFSDEVSNNYHTEKEPIQEQDYRKEMELRRLERCL